MNSVPFSLSFVGTEYLSHEPCALLPLSRGHREAFPALYALLALSRGHRAAFT